MNIQGFKPSFWGIGHRKRQFIKPGIPGSSNNPVIKYLCGCPLVSKPKAR
jgi:hypothetical protein